MKKGILAGTCIIMLTVGVYGTDAFQHESEPIHVETVAVKTQNLYNSVVAQGSVVGYERQSIIFSGTSNILDVYVTEGQTVEKGDKILLRKTSDSESGSLQTFANSVHTFLTEHGIDSSFLPTVSKKTALVTSNINGIVTSLDAKPGAAVSGFTVAAEITDTSTCTVLAEIPELYISSVCIGQEAVVNGSAFAKESYHGTVSVISGKAQKKINLTGEGSNYFPVTITLTETDRSIRPGCTASVKIKTAEKKNASVIPYECIIQDENGKEFVYVLKNDGSIEMRRILTGLELKDETEIIYGLKPGERVILDPGQMQEKKERSE